jgi:hypothetical protein
MKTDLFIIIEIIYIVFDKLNMKKVFLIFTAAIALNIYSCCNCDEVKKYFDVNGFSAKGYKMGQTGSLDSTEKVNLEEYYIDLTFNKTYYSECKQQFDFSNLFFTNAYACKCSIDGSYGTSEKIDSIQIFSSYLFDSLTSINESISKNFTVITNVGSQVNLNEYTQSKPNPSLFYLRLKLNTKPTASLKHQFTIVYKQTNGETYVAKTPLIEFLK